MPPASFHENLARRPRRHDGHGRRQKVGAPAVERALDEDALGLTARALVKRPQEANHARVRDGLVVFGLHEGRRKS